MWIKEDELLTLWHATYEVNVAWYEKSNNKTYMCIEIVITIN